MLGTCTKYKLQAKASLRTFDSMGIIAGSELGRPALAGLSSLTTWVEETIAKVQLLGDVTAALMVAIEHSATTRAVTSISRAIDEQQQQRLTPVAITSPSTSNYITPL